MTFEEFNAQNYPLTLTKIFDEVDGWLWKAEYQDLKTLVCYDESPYEAVRQVQETKEHWFQLATLAGIIIPYPKSDFAFS